MKKDLKERLFQFATRCIKYIRKMPDTSEYKVIKYQLLKSSTSSGANYEEAQAGSSKPDFCNKVSISLKEMRETNYWLRIIKEIKIDKTEDEELLWLLNESVELKNILGSIVVKSKS
ncbi:MAG: four helix bundle protein [Salinivirgaceae bacterium]|nr:four helix bundle protein [Salinivirgaceae bacterium]